MDEEKEQLLNCLQKLYLHVLKMDKEQMESFLAGKCFTSCSSFSGWHLNNSPIIPEENIKMMRLTIMAEMQ